MSLALRASMRKKLRLNRETLRRLDPAYLRQVAGGVRSIVNPPPIPTVGGNLTCEPCQTWTCLTQCPPCGTVIED